MHFLASKLIRVRNVRFRSFSEYIRNHRRRKFLEENFGSRKQF